MRGDLQTMRDAGVSFMRRSKTCVWAIDDNWDGCMWETSCGQAFQFTDGGPEENSFKFCYHCGKPIQIVRASFFEGAKR